MGRAQLDWKGNRITLPLFCFFPSKVEFLICGPYSASSLVSIRNKTLHRPGGCSPSAAPRKCDSLSNDGEQIMPASPTHINPLSPSALSSVPGGHVNPAVSLAMVILGKLKIWKFPFYVIAQFLGAFAGAAAVFGLYYGEYNELYSLICWTKAAGSDLQMLLPNLKKEPTLLQLAVSSLCCHISVCPPHRCFHGLHQWDSVGDGNQCNRSHFCFLPCETPVNPRWLHWPGEVWPPWPNDPPPLSPPPFRL